MTTATTTAIFALAFMALTTAANGSADEIKCQTFADGSVYPSSGSESTNHKLQYTKALSEFIAWLSDNRSLYRYYRVISFTKVSSSSFQYRNRRPAGRVRQSSMVRYRNWTWTISVANTWCSSSTRWTCKFFSYTYPPVLYWWWEWGVLGGRSPSFAFLFLYSIYIYTI